MAGYRILIVDDDEDNHAALGDYLLLSGYAVSHAYDGKRALEMMQIERPDLVLLDVMMPEMDGFRTMEAIGKQDALRELPVIFLTSLARSNLVVKGIELGAEDYIIKPPNKPELLARIRKALRSGRRYQRVDGALFGSLDDLAVAEIMQTFDMSRKSARIVLDEMDAEIIIADRLLLFARYQRNVGANALQRVLLRPRGSFSVAFDAPLPEDAEPPLSIQNALMRAMTAIDELGKLLERLPTEGTPLELAGDASAFPAFALLGTEGCRAAIDLVVEVEGNMKENAALLLEALAAGVVRPVAQEEKMPDPEKRGQSWEH